MINQAILLIKINIINNKTDDLTKAYHLLNLPRYFQQNLSVKTYLR